MNGSTLSLTVERGVASKVDNFFSFSLSASWKRLLTSDIRIFDQCGNTLYVQKLLEQQLQQQQLGNARKRIDVSFTANYLLSGGVSFVQFFNLTRKILH